ncbi:Gfo/Idh/MocA family oxidoreductase [Kitasatospora sp. NPDC006697]|uniref:Gfo/Idh/MocA family oxidoreductase n=1 Tax=Kitasatospora sp. NPDC006697 TaxID=3364020 RepID=UPI0036753EE7
MEVPISTAALTDPGAWIVLRGPATPESVREAAQALAERHGLVCHPRGDSALALGASPAAVPLVTVRWQALAPQPPRTLGFQLPPPAALDILIDPGPGEGAHLARELHQRLAEVVLPYTAAELDGIRASMPLVDRYSTGHPAFQEWALLFRDHYLEHSVGFLLGMERAGIPAQWIFALDKGDRTFNRDRVHATFLARGYRSDVLDNGAVNDPDAHTAELERVTAAVDAFIDQAHTAGRRVLVVDDGGLLARGYGATAAPRRVDAALELTVSGIKRITAAGPLAIPVLNLARSQVKTHLGYLEIADSCLRRLRAIVPDRKFIGRHVLILGHGTLGSRLAPALRTLGCRVSVVDTDLLALIGAAEAGYTTHRTARQALTAEAPFLVIGTTGEIALTEDDLALLPDGVLLAPFATRDFSALTEGPRRQDATEIPGIGLRFPLPGRRTATLLGNGRSMNLFEADSIPNQGYDAYRAGTLIAATALCADPAALPPGLHAAPANEAITAAGLLDAYYDLYIAPQPARLPAVPLQGRRPALSRAAVVGYGVAGRLHAQFLTELGATMAIIDPKHQDLPASPHTFRHEVGELPAAMAAGIDLWSICCPTADHLPVLRTILARNPAARVLLEKPACQGHEIDAFTDLLAHHPGARVIVNDQYRHSTAVRAFTDLVTHLEPGAPIDRIQVVFTKDRGPDSAAGRFVDRTYGVLGYEWLHMLAVLREILPPHDWDAYLATDPAAADTDPTWDARLFVPALTERTTLHSEQGSTIRLALTSSILGPCPADDTTPEPRPPWRQGLRTADDRYRHVTAHAGVTRFTLHLDPVTAPGGWQLERNHHRITAVRDGQVVHDEVLHDSPLRTSVHHAVTALLADPPPPAPDLAPLRRIAALAEVLRSRAPQHLPAPRPATA